MEQQPLVSVVVITYNSSATVLETLESIKKQTYQNVELIVSDDSSTDDTQSLVLQWLKKNENKFSFKRAILTSTPTNGGPAVNCNHGIRNTGGEWIKLIAGDDLLLPECIEKNVKFVLSNPSAKIVFSKMSCFGDDNKATLVQSSVNWNYRKLSTQQQFVLMLLSNRVSAPSALINRQVWCDLGEFDENIPFLEDWPFWIKAMKAGISISFMDEFTICYRTHDSLSLSKTPSKRFLDSYDRAKHYAHKCQREYSILLRLYSLVLENVDNAIAQKLFLALNPFYWYVRYLNFLMK